MTLLWLGAHLIACLKLVEQFSAYLPVSNSIFPNNSIRDMMSSFQYHSPTITGHHSKDSFRESYILTTEEQKKFLFSVDLLNYFSVTCALAITAITRISFLVKTIMILVVILQQVILNKTILSNLLMLRSTFMLVLPQNDFNQLHSDQSTIIKSNQTSKLNNIPTMSNNNNIELGDLLAEFDQYVFTVTLITLCLALFSMNRHFELTNRRMFLYRKQAEERKEKVADMRRKNEMLVYNILPPNVAKIFLGKRQLNDEELYSKSYDAVGVLFAAMPNFSDFYTEESVNNQGLECLRFLNEVISDYDALLDQDRFKNIIKIKTMGSTYMAASGLYEGDAANSTETLKIDQEQNPASSGANCDASASCGGSTGHEISRETEIRSKWGHLEQLTEFALALKDTLNNINKESFNNFVLRIGESQDNLIAPFFHLPA